MDASEQSRFDELYARHLRALKLQGKAPATVDGYARALRRAADHFDRCPDRLSVEDFQSYFATLIDSRSWSLVKIDRCGLQFGRERSTTPCSPSLPPRSRASPSASSRPSSVSAPCCTPTAVGSTCTRMYTSSCPVAHCRRSGGNGARSRAATCSMPLPWRACFGPRCCAR